MYDLKNEMKKILKEALTDATAEFAKNDTVPSVAGSSSTRFQELWKSNQRQFKGALAAILCTCGILFVINPNNFLENGIWPPMLVFTVMLVISYLGIRLEEMEKRFGRWVFGRTSNGWFSYKWYYVDGA